ncbi:MAG: glutaminase, partial [Pseudaminobacter sp.]|nr:glutaminase [Pseudaminobacter sp.]
MPEVADVLSEIAAEMAASTDRGDVATYIPQLGVVDPRKFGISVAMVDGPVFCAGDARQSFSIQSISKVFTLTLALGKIGDALWRRVGREPSGNSFNSIVQLEQERGIPRNPFINAGAIVVSDILLAGHQPREAIGEILRFVQFLADDETVFIDSEVAVSERATG